MTGVFGSDIKSFIVSAAVGVTAFLAEHDKSLDRLWRLIGALGTILSISWGIYKSWYYAERNLPTRIEEFLARNDDRLQEARSILLARIIHRYQRCDSMDGDEAIVLA